MREEEKRIVRAVEIACLIFSCERVNGGENRGVKWAYVVVWRDVKQRNTALVVDLYLTIRFVAQCGVCVAARASPGGRHLRHRRTRHRASRHVAHRRIHNS